jgi:hypothetical protein
MPTGIFSLPLHYLMETLVNCAAFRAWVGAETVEAARAFIYPVSTPVPIPDPPFAWCNWADDFSLDRIESGTSSSFNQSGDLLLMFRGRVEKDPDGKDYPDYEVSIRFLNPIGAIVKELTELSGAPGYLNIKTIKMEVPPQRPSEREILTAKKAGAETETLIGDYFQVIFRIDWGVV